MATAACRPVSPLIANIAAIAISSWSVLFFWLGVWPLALLVVIGSMIDLTSRTASTRPIT
jgi:hypothetical protein